MSLTLALNTALSGLNVNRQSLANLSQNIANANNPNYSRKITLQASVTLNGVGAGVSIEDIGRKIDTYLQQAMRTQNSVVGRSGALSDYSQRLQLLLGSPGAGNGLNSFVTNMFNAMQSLAETPESSSNRVNVVNAAQTLVDEMNNLYDGVQQLRFDADQEIRTSVSTINLKLNEIYGLNAAVSNAKALSRPYAELLDKRDAAIQTLSEHIDINVYERDEGIVNIYARGGATLLDLNLYELQYSPISSPDSLNVDDPQFSPLRVFLVGESGERISESLPIITGGSSDEVTTGMNQGRIKALIEVRDDVLTDMVEQLDMFTATMRDAVNAVHNAGSGYPGDRILTGTRPTTAQSFSNWQGQVRIGLVDINGQPMPSPFANEQNGLPPLTIDLASLDAGLGQGPGYPTTQSIINEINNYYGIPRTKVSLGDLNNIELASSTNRLPSSYFNFDFDLTNISGNDAKFFVTSVSVTDDTNTDMTSVTSTVPTFTLDATGSYATTAGSSTVTIGASGHNLVEGDYIYLPQPSTAVGGIAASNLTGVFQITNVTASGFDISVVTQANSSASHDQAVTAYKTYADSLTGTKDRTTENGTFSADLSSNLSSSYYTVSADVAVVNEDGTTSDSTISYQVGSNAGNLQNRRYGASAATGAAELSHPTQNTQPLVRAKLVGADGREVGKVNNQYFADAEGFLQLEVNGSNYFLSIDSLDSMENGNPAGAPFVLPGTQRGFSHYFELNNFFSSNAPSSTGDTVLDSAANFQIESRIRANPGRVSTGRLVLQSSSADPNIPPSYAYERISGDDSIAQRLADISNSLLVFDQAGGLSTTNQTLSGYAGEILGFAGSNANSSESNFENVKVILQGFQERSSAISGVNLDEELGNMMIYQNAYTASARIITVTNELFETLMNTF